MIDRDLAELFGVETGALKQAVRRNSWRFAEDFTFETNATEEGRSLNKRMEIFFERE